MNGTPRDGQRGRGGDHRDDVGLVLAVVGEDLRDHEDLVVEAFREQRADRAVDQAAGQRFLFGRAALALEEAARDAPGGREFFLVVDGQREEVLARLDRLGGGDRAEHDGFAEGREHRAVGLTGNAARFELEGLSAPLDFDSFRIEHFFSFIPRGRMPAGDSSGRRAGPRAVRGLDLPLRPSAELRMAPICEAAPRGRRLRLLAKTELRDEIGVALRILAAEVIEQRAALVDHHQQAAARMVVLGVGLEMLGQRLDAAGQDRDLDFGRTRCRPWRGACSLITSCLRSAVIDIVSLLFVSKVEPPDDLQAVGRGFDQRHRSSRPASPGKAPALRGTRQASAHDGAAGPVRG